MSTTNTSEKADAGQNSAKHTPGPWILRPCELPGAYEITTHDSPLTIGFVCHDIPAGEDNAYLIASAPGLLAERDALKAENEMLRINLVRLANIVERKCSSLDTESMVMLCEARAALARKGDK